MKIWHDVSVHAPPLNLRPLPNVHDVTMQPRLYDVTVTESVAGESDVFDCWCAAH